MFRPTFLVAFALAGFAGSTAAQTTQDASPPMRVELWGGVSKVIAAPVGDLVSSYSPPLLFTSDFTSRSGQTLALEASSDFGFEAGVNLFPTSHLGVQMLVNRASMDLGGTNGPYALGLTYVSRQPPDSQPQTFTLQQSIPWPDTSGSLTQLTIAVNPVARLGRPDGLNVTVSGGLSYYRLNGTAQPVGYTAFRLGGHSVLFSDEYHLAVSLEPTNVVGFNAGGEVNLPLGRHAAIVAGYRYLGGPTTDVPVRLSTIVNADQVTNQETTANIAERLAPGPARISVSGSRLLFGVKLRP
jgi:hypothetical protein